MITTRPSETAPVAGAIQCNRHELRLSYGGEGASQSIVGSYRFTNVGSAICRLGGYPRLVLRTSDGGTAGNVQCRRRGHPSELFLHPGESADATTQTFLSEDLPVRANVTIEQVYLPGVREPFTQWLDRGGIPMSDGGLTIDVSPLEGD